MSYLVLARKWRPQSFRDIVGQEHVTTTLENAIGSERVAHAYLFTGARGVGKTSAARVLAKALNCEKGPTTEPCNSCPPCLEISSGTAVDVHEIDGASNTSVDDVRELKESINYLPSSCRKKIYIIDEVHMLSTSAFNALLKTLEEPPSHVIFIFATTEPHKIPGTILSRCQRFDFKKIPVKLIFDRLKTIINDEGVNIEDKGLMVIAREADGGMRDAQSLLDQVISFSGKEVSAKDIVDVLGVIDTALIQETASAVIKNDLMACLEIVNRLVAYGWDVKEFGKGLHEYFRNLAVVKVAPKEQGLVDSTTEEIEIMKEIAAEVDMAALYLYFDVMTKGMEDLGRSVHPKITLEMLLLKLASMENLTDIATLIASVQGMAGQEESASPLPDKVEKNNLTQEFRNSPTEELRVESPVTDYSHDVAGLDEKKDSWPGFVHFVKNKKGSLGTILEHAHLINFNAESISIAPDNDFSYDKAKDELNYLISLSREYFDREVAIDIQPPSKEEATINSVHEERKKKESDLSRKLKKEAMDHPMVLESLGVFGGEVKEIKTELTFSE